MPDKSVLNVPTIHQYQLGLTLCLEGNVVHQVQLAPQYPKAAGTQAGLYRAMAEVEDRTPFAKHRS